MPVILATWEAEIRRIVIRNQPWQVVHETTKKGWWSGSRCRPRVQAPEPEKEREREREREREKDRERERILKLESY
jgi:hypothetical protein